jgi:RNA polymerase sigma-70 factor (ECF subfamily)
MIGDDRFEFPAGVEGVLADCRNKAAAPAAWQLTEEQFRAVLARSASQKFSGRLPDKKTLENYLGALHLQDLALAAACSAGNAAAWDVFVARYRPELYRAARAIAGESQGRDLADSLYAELFGLRESDGQRKSLFDYFHGRSKLGTWLRAILAQRHIDHLRRAARTESVDDSLHGHHQEREIDVPNEWASGVTAPDPDRDRFLAILQTAVTAVLAALNPRDRLRLAYYYVNGLTLAQIGKLLGEHEATVSRKLDRTRREVRQRVEAMLREKNLSEAQLAQCLEYARHEWPFDLAATLSARD